MSSQSLEERCRSAGNPVDMLRNSQIGPYVYPSFRRIHELAGRAARLARDVLALRSVAPHDRHVHRGPGRAQAAVRHRRQQLRDVQGRTRPSSSSPATTTATSSATRSCSTSTRTCSASSGGRRRTTGCSTTAKPAATTRRSSATSAPRVNPSDAQVLPLPGAGPARAEGDGEGHRQAGARRSSSSTWA